MAKANLTLYTILASPACIPANIQQLFAPVTQSFIHEGERITVKLQDGSSLIFHLSHIQEKAEFIEMHTTGMANYFAQAETSRQELKEYVLHQIHSFNCILGITFETDENDERTRYIINTLFDLAHLLNGFLLYPNMHLYNSDGKLVFSNTGESELKELPSPAPATVPEQEQSTTNTTVTARRERTLVILKEQGISYTGQLPAEISEDSTQLKSREEMTQRAAVLFAIAVYSEVLLSDHPDREEGLAYYNKLDEIYGISQWLTPAETAYLSNPDSTEHERIQFVWRYENCATLLWAAGIVEELPYPSEICDVPVIAAIFWQHQGIEHLLSEGTARTPGEILDAADLTYCYDWACVEARIHQKEAPAGLDGGIVMERHYTFNWIIGANDNATWDEIQPNT